MIAINCYNILMFIEYEIYNGELSCLRQLECLFAYKTPMHS